MHTQMDYIVLRDLDRRITDLQNTTDRNLAAIRSEMQLHRQEMNFRLSGMAIDIRTIREATAKAAKPVLDLAAIWQSLWFRVALLAMLGASNKELLEIVSASFVK